jgi:hypothetical protein
MTYLKGCTDIYTGTLKKTTFDLDISSRQQSRHEYVGCRKRVGLNSDVVAYIHLLYTKLTI